MLEPIIAQDTPEGKPDPSDADREEWERLTGEIEIAEQVYDTARIYADEAVQAAEVARRHLLELCQQRQPLSQRLGLTREGR